MEQLSRTEKIAYMRKNNKYNKSYHSYQSTKSSISRKNYNSIYTSTKLPTEQQDNVSYIEQTETKETSFFSFQFRMAIASFLFLAFLGMKEHDFIYGNISCETIVETISNNNGMRLAEEKVIATFNNLK